MSPSNYNHATAKPRLASVPTSTQVEQTSTHAASPIIRGHYDDKAPSPPASVLAPTLATFAVVLSPIPHREQGSMLPRRNHVASSSSRDEKRAIASLQAKARKPNCMSVCQPIESSQREYYSPESKPRQYSKGNFQKPPGAVPMDCQ